MTLIELVKNVVTSWQVIVVTLAILIYFLIVTQAAKAYRRPSAMKNLKPKNLFKKKEKPAEAAAAGPEVSESDTNHVDDLGIEEA